MVATGDRIEMKMTKTKKKINFTEGPLFTKLLIFMLPIVATSLLQILYDVADKVVVGQFSGDTGALGAIGSTSFISGLIINFMIGVGAGAGVVVAHAYGAKDNDAVSRSTHNALILGFFLSLVMTAIAYVTAAPLLKLLDTDAELFDSALLYLNIIYSSILATAIYNIGASILRAIGDSSTSLHIGIVSGIINVILNLFFVIVCGMSVEGVAIATVISKYYSASAVVISLYRRKGESYAFDPKKLIPHKPTLLRMLRLGIPTGLQSACYSLGNMASTAAINSFEGTVYISARSIATDIDHIAHAFVSAFLPAALNATGQNVGAKQPKRIKRILVFSLAQAAVVVSIVSGVLLLFLNNISAMFVSASDPLYAEKLAAVSEWCSVMLPAQIIAAILNVSIGVVRGLGYSVIPLVINLLGTVGLRLAWIYGLFFAFEELHTFFFLALMYPVSNGTTALAGLILAVIAITRMNKKLAKEAEEAENSADTPRDEEAIA